MVDSKEVAEDKRMCRALYHRARQPDTSDSSTSSTFYNFIVIIALLLCLVTVNYDTQIVTF